MATTSKDGSRRETCLFFCVGGSYGTCVVAVCKENCLYRRASRVPAAAVIPAPIVSMVNAAVKMSVVAVLRALLGLGGMSCGACVFCGLWMYLALCATDEGLRMVGREVKCGP